jgi:hypothetical protein
MNVALHAAVTALVFALSIRFGAPLVASTVAAAVFAVHPVHVEVAANLAGRGELLACLFALSAVFTHLGPAPRDPGSTESSGMRGWGRQAGVLAFFALALGAKEHAIMLPGLLAVVVLVRARSGGSYVRELVKHWPLWLGLVAVAAGYLAMRVGLGGTMATRDVAPFIGNLPTSARITTAIANWFEYLRLMLFPYDFSVDYGPAVIVTTTASDLRFWLGLGGGVGAAALAASTWRARPLLALGVAWFAVAILPTSNLFIPISIWLAERFLYLPSVGFAFAVAGGVAWVLERGRGARGIVAVLLLAVLIAMTVRTWERNETWRDSDTVATTLIEEHPDSYRSQYILANFYWNQRRFREAMQAINAAIRVAPDMQSLKSLRKTWLDEIARARQARKRARRTPPTTPQGPSPAPAVSR